MTMKMALRRWLWISILLVTAVRESVSANSLKDTENEAIRLIRKDFHKTNKIKNSFQVSSILNTVYQEHSDGTFVKVKFTMKQTKCERRKWMNPDCTPIMTAKRTFNCFGCFKFHSNGDLFKTGYKKCVRQSHAKMKEVKKERRKACDGLKEKKIYDVGVYSFRRAPRGQYEN